MSTESATEAIAATEAIEAITVEPTITKARLKLKPSDPIEALSRGITQEHAEALTSMVDSVRHAAKAGDLLVEARNKISDSFRKWVSDTLPFTYRTAYRYMKISEAVSDGAISLDGVTSINEALKLLASATKDKEEDKGEPKEKDERIETFVTAAMKIESWFKKETSKAPLSTWSADRRSIVKAQLEGVNAIYEAL